MANGVRVAVDLTVLHLADIINERELRYEQRFQAQEAAIGVAKMEADTKYKEAQRLADKKYAELNDVQRRFVPRDILDVYKDEQMRKARATILAVITLGIATGGLLIELLP